MSALAAAVVALLFFAQPNCWLRDDFSYIGGGNLKFSYRYLSLIPFRTDCEWDPSGACRHDIDSTPSSDSIASNATIMHPRNDPERKISIRNGLSYFVSSKADVIESFRWLVSQNDQRIWIKPIFGQHAFLTEIFEDLRLVRADEKKFGKGSDMRRGGMTAIGENDIYAKIQIYFVPPERAVWDDIHANPRSVLRDEQVSGNLVGLQGCFGCAFGGIGSFIGNPQRLSHVAGLLQSNEGNASGDDNQSDGSICQPPCEFGKFRCELNKASIKIGLFGPFPALLFCFLFSLWGWNDIYNDRRWSGALVLGVAFFGAAWLGGLLS